MDERPACPVCGRPKTESARRQWVSCCSRGVLPPRTPAEATSALDRVNAILDRALVSLPGTIGPAWVAVAALGIGAALFVATWMSVRR